MPRGWVCFVSLLIIRKMNLLHCLNPCKQERERETKNETKSQRGKEAKSPRGAVLSLVLRSLFCAVAKLALCQAELTSAPHWAAAPLRPRQLAIQHDLTLRQHLTTPPFWHPTAKEGIHANQDHVSKQASKQASQGRPPRRCTPSTRRLLQQLDAGLGFRASALCFGLAPLHSFIS